MKILFTGRDNAFNRRLINYFSSEHEIVCCLFLEPERASWKGKLYKIKGRIKKYGFIRVLDQLAFHWFDRLFLRKNESVFWKRRPEYCDNSIKIESVTHQVDDINSEEWVELCRNLLPDIILATCSHVIFKSAFYKIPSLGTYVIHEGLTPEYKGLHTPLWALMKKEPEYIGYTVLKVNDKIDGGEILVQNRYRIEKGENYRTWSWIGHNAIISGLENIMAAFRQLERNKYFVPVDKSKRKSGYYTWMGLSNFLWLYYRNYWSLSNAKKLVSIRYRKLIKPTTENATLR